MQTRVPLDMMAFGQRLRWFREAHLLAPDELAELANYAWRSLKSPGRRFTESWIRLMERGSEGAVHTVAYYRIVALAMALEIAPEHLMTYESHDQRGEIGH
ncbi:MAG: helix-turn-helix domain-containing protein [Firmicutes bacterium]|nr:helix-turn-helix domain-containing protein [Bacillota bacterium]